MERRQGLSLDLLGVGRARGDLFFGHLQSAVNDGRDAALGRREPAVTRAEREPIGFPYGRHGNDLNGQVQIGHHAPDGRELLRVLFPEIGAIRLHDVEQLEHHGRHSAEVAGAKLTAEVIGDAQHVHENQLGSGIHLLDGGREDHVHAAGGAELQVFGEWPGVQIVVFLLVELGGIHKDAHHHAIGLLARHLDQAAVPGVQCAHGGHESDDPAGAADLRQPVPQLENRRDQFGAHGRAFRADNCSGAGNRPSRTSWA